MTNRLDPGHYEVESSTSDNDDKAVSRTASSRVIRGDTANEELPGQYGFRASKWYAYTMVKTSVTPKLNFSPTAPTRAHRKSFREHRFIEEEFDTKKEAVEAAEEELVNDYNGDTRVSPPTTTQSF